MRQLDSLIMKAADLGSVPAAEALAVDRRDFAGYVTETLKNHTNVTVHHEEIEAIPDGPTIVATGPLTSAALSESLIEFTCEDYLEFFDEAALILDGDTIDRE
jgi:methylenetetrahydrofolate--tRNA-(uracil-5-)-methyltransferase